MFLFNRWDISDQHMRSLSIGSVDFIVQWGRFGRSISIWVGDRLFHRNFR